MYETNFRVQIIFLLAIKSFQIRMFSFLQKAPPFLRRHGGPVNIYWVPRPGFGKNLSEKKSSPSFFSRKKSHRPLIFSYFFEKTLYYMSSKSSLTLSHEKKPLYVFIVCIIRQQTQQRLLFDI